MMKTDGVIAALMAIEMFRVKFITTGGIMYSARGTGNYYGLINFSPPWQDSMSIRFCFASEGGDEESAMS